MGIPDEAQRQIDELKSKVRELDAKTIDARLDAGFATAATWAEKISPLYWLARLFAVTPLWLQLILMVALIAGAWFGWNAFVDWAALRGHDAATVQMQAEVKAAKDEAAKLKTEASELTAEYEVLVKTLEMKTARVAELEQRAGAQGKRTAVAEIKYSDSLKKPVAAITIDASTDAALEASLKRLNEATREAMRRAGQ